MKQLVDAVHFDFVPSVGAVVLEDDIMARMRKFGENIAHALLIKEKGEKPAYAGVPGGMSRLSWKYAGNP